MRQFMALIKREYWEWKRVILWTLGVFMFLLLLSLIQLNRTDTLSKDKTHGETEESDSDFSEMESFYREQGYSEEQIDETITKLKGMQDNSNDAFNKTDSNVKKRLTKFVGNSPVRLIKIYSFGILAGFSMLQVLVLFIALFYFSDSLYKERSNYSTLFFRSLPVNDHLILFSKLKAGGIGIIGLTILMLAILLVYARIAIMTISGDIWNLISSVIDRVNVFGLFGDLILIQIVSLLWLSPLILFLMFVSASVKNRPLIIGIGVPLLLAATLQVVYGENAFVTQIGDAFGAIVDMILQHNLINGMTSVPAGGVDLFDSLWGELFSIRTLVSLLISSLFYGTTWIMYRKNISTN